MDNNESSIKSLIKNAFSAEAKLSRMPYYCIAICILLVVVIIQLNTTNNYLKRIAFGDKPYSDFNSTNSEQMSSVETSSDDPFEIFSVESTTLFYNEELSTTASSYVSENTTEQTTHIDIQATTSNQSNNVVVNPADTTSSETKPQSNIVTYVINKNSHKIHYSNCSYASNMKEENRLVVKLTYPQLKDQYLSQGYTFCSRCGG